MKFITVKCESSELADRRFREFCNHQVELRTLYAEQEARERRRNAAKAARAKKMRHEVKVAKTWFCAGLTVFSLSLYAAQVAGLIDPVLSIPAMVICFGMVVWFLSDIVRIVHEERKDSKGRFER